MKNLIFPLIILLVVGAFVYFSGAANPLFEKKDTTSNSSSVISTVPTSTAVVSQTFDIKGLNYTYDVKEIKVKLNDLVKINFINTEGMHDFKIDEFNVATKVIKTGESEMVEFVANKAGTFEYYCSVGQHRSMGMVGKLIVE